jgi:hypothetical protein
LASSLGIAGSPREAYQLDLRQWVQWCGEHQFALLGRAGRTSKASAATSKRVVERGRPSRAGCARSPPSIAMPKKKD